MLNFIDISTHKKLKIEEEKSKQLRTLSASVHHEMLGPLKSNVEFAEYLIKHLKDPTLQKKSELILISSKLVLFHADDLLDLQFLETGNFSASYAQNNTKSTINEIVNLV